MEISRIILFFLTLTLMISCSKEETNGLTSGKPLLPAEPYPYSSYDLHPSLKTAFEAAQDNMPVDNPTTDWGATLGRVLFYDRNLSVNRTIACASCHIQKFGFTDTARFSRGFEGGRTNRHSMALANARYYANKRFFWDERAASLEDQVLMPIQDKIEMGMTMEGVRSRIRNLEYYSTLFIKAYGDDSVSDKRISMALAQFVRSIISTSTKFDNGLLANGGDPLKPFPNFTHSENRGKEIFYTNPAVPCSGCHLSKALVSDHPRNNGIFDGDQGVFSHNPQPQFMNTFKAPSLRNVALRSHFMHGGNFSSLDEVVEHYNSGLTNPDNTLDHHLTGLDNKGAKMHLSAEDKAALVDFLKTLTDEEMTVKEAYSNPFR